MRTYVFIDAANLFYGFDTEYGWRIDYLRLRQYLEEKYHAQQVCYFGGIDVHLGIRSGDEFVHDYSFEHTVDICRYLRYLRTAAGRDDVLSEGQMTLIKKAELRAKFYKKLESFGYQLFLKPVKRFPRKADSLTQGKANCDVDLAVRALSTSSSYERAIVLSGDGDFLPLYKELESAGKLVYVLSRSKRTAREVRQYLGPRFIEIQKLRPQIEFLEKKEKDVRNVLFDV